MFLVALQVGMQPAVTRACVSSEVSGQSLVIVEIIVSMILAVMLTPMSEFVRWSLVESCCLAGPAALVYAVRSLFKQAAYRRCDSVTFNVINQTKVVFCALGAWFLMQEGQSPQQVLALLCAVFAGALLVIPSAPSNGDRAATATAEYQDNGSQCQRQVDETTASAKIEMQELKVTRRKVSNEVITTCGAASNSLSQLRVTSVSVTSAVPPAQKHSRTASAAISGAVLALATAVCSGTAAAMSQRALRGTTRPSSLFNFELAFWGAPFVVATSVVGVGKQSSLVLRGWDACTMAPVVLQAAGGLLVSAVVQQQGGVAMGLCTVAGIAVSAATDALLTKRLPSQRQMFASLLAVASVAMHQHA
jgi:drug/metabolite transporter (DMT)-like permease